MRVPWGSGGFATCDATTRRVWRARGVWVVFFGRPYTVNPRSRREGANLDLPGVFRLVGVSPGTLADTLVVAHGPSFRSADGLAAVSMSATATLDSSST
jgi:hypothetical protein